MTQIPPPWLAENSHDQRLLERVLGGEAYVRPTPVSRYNLVVVGGGPAGLVAAAGAAGLGAKVALVERGPLGGDCLHFGCVPSKALLRPAHLAADLRDAAELGLRRPDGQPLLASPARFDFQASMERLRRLRSEIAENDSVTRFTQLGIDVYFGEGRFTSRDTLAVGDVELRFVRAAIATGTRPTIPDIPGIERAPVLTSESVFSLASLPSSLLVMGGGPIGCELSQAFARLGAKVTLVQSRSRLLPRDDADAAELVRRQLERDGVDVLCGAKVERIETREGDSSCTARIIDSHGASREQDFEYVLVATGRRPNVESLQLERAGIEFDVKRGIVVDDFLRTTNSHVYAAGDVTATAFRFTHAADAMARIVVQNSLFFGRARWSRAIIPWSTYTSPEVAHVGIEAEARLAAGVRISTITVPWTQLDRARLDGTEEGWVKVHLHAGTDRIAGATIAGRHAGDLIGQFALAMHARWGLKKLSRVVYPYPTYGEIVRKVADAYNRTRVTPTLRGILGRYFAWRRGAGEK